MLIKNAYIMTMDDGAVFENGYILTKNGKILSVGNMDNLPQNDDAEVIDAKGCYVIPGLIDAHCHLGVFGDSLGFEGSDGNEEVFPQTSHLRAIDAVNPMDKCFEDARRGGVTSVVTGPGSTNVIGGQTAAIKTHGIRIDDMIIKAPCSVKCAFGENPKRIHSSKNQSPMTRMATAAIFREAMYGAMNYGERIINLDTVNPAIDIKAEPLLSVLKKHIPIHAHTHRADDIFTAIRLAKEFNIEVKIVHGTEGHLIADELSSEGVDVMIGPIISIRSKPEMKNLSPDSAAILEDAGVRIAITTDHPEVPIEHLLLSAQIAVKNGMTAQGALRAVTCDAAAIAGIADRVGRLCAGFDADMVVFDKNPLDFDSKVLLTIIDDVKVYKADTLKL